ncbi:unnamed protein product [Closterium sp. NIES-54]
MAERQQERASPSQLQQQQNQPGAPMATDAQTEVRQRKRAARENPGLRIVCASCRLADLPSDRYSSGSSPIRRVHPLLQARAASVEAVQAAQEAEEASKRAYVKQAQAQEKMQLAAQVAAQQQQAARQAASMAASEAARAVREDERAAGRQQQQESAVQGMIAQQAAQMAVQQQQQQQPQQPMQAPVQQQQEMVTGPGTAPLPGAGGSYYSTAPGAAMSGVEGAAAPSLAAVMQGEHAGAAAQAFVAQMASEAAETAAQSMAAAQHMAASAPNDAAVQQVTPMLQPMPHM